MPENPPFSRAEYGHTFAKKVGFFAEVFTMAKGRITTVRLDEDVESQLRLISSVQGISRSALIGLLLRTGLERMLKDPDLRALLRKRLDEQQALLGTFAPSEEEAAP